MGVKILPYTPLDYPLIASWYNGWNQPAPPPNAFPKTGLIAFKGETPIACVFIYRTDSSIAVVECLITNPHTAKVERREAFERLWEAVKMEIKKTGHSLIMAMPTHPNIVKFLENKGLKIDPTPYTFLVGGV